MSHTARVSLTRGGGCWLLAALVELDRFGDHLEVAVVVEVAKDGWRSENYSEEAAAAHMKGENIVIGVDLGLGAGAATVWTCDLTHGYISINADYRS